MHIATVSNHEDKWQKLAELISEYHGTEFNFDPSKVYRIQNLGSSKLLIVESEADLADSYNEGEVYVANSFFNYTPVDRLNLWVRSSDVNRITVTEVQESKVESSIEQINETLGYTDSQLQEI